MSEFQPTPLSDIVKRDDKGRFAPTEPATDAADSVTPSASEPKVETPAVTAPSPSPTGDTPNSAEAKPGPSPVPENVESPEVKALKAELARLRQQRREPVAPAPQAPKPPSVFEDEEGFANHLTSTFEERLFSAKLEMSEDTAREKFSDLKEVMGTVGEGDETLHVNWIEAVKENPALSQQFRRAANPVVFAYQELKRLNAMKEIGDPAAYKEKLRQELMAELAAKPAGTPAATPATGQTVPAKPEPVIPDTLAGASSKAQREAPEFNGPTPLTAIIKSAPHMQRLKR